MSARNQQRILNILRSYGADSDAEIADAADEAVRVTYGDLPPEVLFGMAETREFEEEGVDIADGRLVGAYALTEHGTLVPAVQVPPIHDALKVRRRGEPAFYVSTGKAYLSFAEKQTGHLLIAPYFSMVADAKEVYVDDLVLDAVGHSTAILWLRRKIASLADRIGELVIPDFPGEPPTAPTITFKPIGATLAGVVTVAPLPAPPSFNILSPTPPTRPGEVDLDVPASLLTIPSVPGGPAINQQDYLRFRNEEDPEMIQMALGKMQQELNQFQLTLERFRADAEVRRTAFMQRLEHYQARSILGIRGGWESETDRYLANYAASLQRAQGILQAEIEGYRAQVQTHHLNAQIAAERALANARLATETEIQVESQRVQTEFQNYANQLRRFEALVARHGILMQSRIAEYEAGLGGLTQEARMRSYDVSRAERAYAEALIRARRGAFTVEHEIDAVRYADHY